MTTRNWLLLMLSWRMCGRGAFNDLCAAFVRHAKIAGLGDGDTVTLKEATDALLHCAEQLRTSE
ncbi:TPA: hypothetical protein ACGGLE_003202 [Escherichia coli]